VARKPATVSGFENRVHKADRDDQVLDLATRFSDGRLSVEKLMTGTDEEVSEMLIAVKGWESELVVLRMLTRCRHWSMDREHVQYIFSSEAEHPTCG
jgi:hypothetical protein